MDIKNKNKMNNIYCVFVLLIPFFVFSPNRFNNKLNIMTVERNCQLYDFANFETLIKREFNLNEVVLLGELNTINNKWFIIKGTTKSDTYQDIGIYIYPLEKSQIADSVVNKRYSYPGKEFTFDNKLIFECRVFFGECTDEYNNSIIWCQKEQIERKWFTSYYVIQFNDHALNAISLSKDKIDLNSLQKNIQINKCKEIQGLDYYNEP